MIVAVVYWLLEIQIHQLLRHAAVGDLYNLLRQLHHLFFGRGSSLFVQLVLKVEKHCHLCDAYLLHDDLTSSLDSMISVHWVILFPPISPLLYKGPQFTQLIPINTMQSLLVAHFLGRHAHPPLTLR